MFLVSALLVSVLITGSIKQAVGCNAAFIESVACGHLWLEVAKSD